MTGSNDTTIPDLNGQDEDKMYIATARKGKENGLFRACMASIRSAHLRANKLRTGLVVLGLFTDKRLYTECLAMFYFVTKELEEKLRSQEFVQSLGERSQKMHGTLLEIGLWFVSGYEQDLSNLLGPDWPAEVERILSTRRAAKAYREEVRAMGSMSQVAAAAFVLWGPLIIGDGAAMMPRVKALVGPGAVNVFRDVTGSQREKRRVVFIRTFDSLADNGTKEFSEVVENARLCMQRNNEMMEACDANPWWMKLLGAVVGVAALYLLASHNDGALWRGFFDNAHKGHIYRSTDDMFEL